MLAKIIDKNRIEVYDLTQFDLAAIMRSGQVFRYYFEGEVCTLISGSHYAKIEAESGKIVIRCDDADYFFNYFDLTVDYNEIKNSFANIKPLAEVIKQCGGIRILKGEFHEVVISFIISANNNIKRFTKTLNSLAQTYGTRLPSPATAAPPSFDSGQSVDIFAFPTLKQLSIVTADDYKRLGCGYRSAYLEEAVKQLNRLDFYSLSTLSTADLHKELLKIKGIGTKVADCIILFAFHRLEAFPVDTWIAKALHEIDAATADTIKSHPFAGIIQQYLFYFFQQLGGELGGELGGGLSGEMGGELGGELGGGLSGEMGGKMGGLGDGLSGKTAVFGTKTSGKTTKTSGKTTKTSGKTTKTSGKTAVFGTKTSGKTTKTDNEITTAK